MTVAPGTEMTSFAAPMSFAQQRLWTLDRIAGGSATYNVPRALRIRGPLDVAAFRLAIASIVARHEILRTRFDLIDGEPMQIVSSALEVPFEIVDLDEIVASKRERRARAILDERGARTFDLATGPLLRVTLVRFDATDHIALVAMHHIVTDEWSNAIFNREFGLFYTAALAGGSAELDELPIQYADYAHWQRESLRGDALASELAFWRTRLAGAPARTELPASDRSDAPGDGGATHTIRIAAPLTRRLRELGTAYGATPFMTFLAAFYVLIYRYTGQNDLVVGSPVAHRQREELEGMIGFFLNTLALRAQLDPQVGFATLLERVRANTLAALDHQQVPFERIVGDLAIARSGSDVPLVNVFFQVGDGRVAPVDVAGLEIAPLALEASVAKFDLSLSVDEVGDGMLCSFTYRVATFQADFIERMAVNFATLLGAIVESPDRPIGCLTLLSESERRQLVEEFNATEVAYPPDTLLDLIERQRHATPDAIALEWEGEDERPWRLTFAELHRRADERARALEAIGVGPDVAVGICLDRSAELVISVLAVLKAGGYYVPLDSDYPAERLAFMVADSRIAVLVTHSRLAARSGTHGATMMLVDADRSVPASLPLTARRAPRPSDIAYMIYTSGSTGRPKGALNRHVGIVNRLLWMQDRYAASAADVILHKTSFSFDVSVWELFWPLCVGARMLLARPGGQRDPEYLARLVVRRGVTIAHFVPSMLRLFVAAEGVAACTSLRDVIASGEELPADLVVAFQARLDAALHNLYGPTEAAIDVTHFTCPPGFEGTSVPIGSPVANTQTYLLDRDLQPVPLGVPAELYIGGVQVGAGYFDRPELTAERFVRDPFRAATDAEARLYRTGDLARQNPDGTIEYRGRLDTQVKLNGLRIELGEIESVLREQSDVRDAAVVIRGVGDDARIVAYVVSDAAERTPDEWRRILGRTLPAYMLPRIVTLPRLPLTPNGKLDYKALPDVGERRGGVANERRNMLHHQLIGMWEAHLGASPIDVHENFFTLGGDSLSAVRLVAEMARTFGRSLHPARFFEEPTIAHIATVLLEEPTDFLTSPLVALQPKGTRAPFFFVDGDLHGGGYYVRGLARRLGDDRPLYALHMPGTQGRPIPATIEAAAAELLALVRRERPHGPYVLGGFCNGGLIAYEIARRLHEQGERVEGLVILEAYGMNARLAPFAAAVDSSLRRLGIAAAKRDGARRAIARGAFRLEQAGRMAARLWRDPRDVVRRFERARAERSAVPVVEGDILETVYRRLTTEFIPQRYPGRLTLLLVDRTGSPDFARLEPKWRHVAERVDRAMLPGTHLSSITRHIDETAMAIGAHLTP